MRLKETTFRVRIGRGRRSNSDDGHGDEPMASRKVLDREVHVGGVETTNMETHPPCHVREVPIWLMRDVDAPCFSTKPQLK
jgi:hypothetical protein